MNSLYQQLQNQQGLPQMEQNQKLSYKIPQNLKAMLNSSNPSELVQNMVRNNPKMQNIMQLFNSSGMTPKDFFYQYAQQKGVDPNQFINSLMS